MDNSAQPHRLQIALSASAEKPHRTLVASRIVAGLLGLEPSRWRWHDLLVNQWRYILFFAQTDDQTVLGHKIDPVIFFIARSEGEVVHVPCIDLAPISTIKNDELAVSVGSIHSRPTR